MGLLKKYVFGQRTVHVWRNHEWSAHAFCRHGRIQRKRPELRLIVSSATLEAQKLADFFNTNKTTDPANDTAAILSIEGSQLTSHVSLPFDDPRVLC